MKKGDKIVFIVIILVLLISSSLVFYYKYSVKGNERIAVIKQDGKVIEKINLKEVKEPKEIKINSYNNHYNVVEVSKGKIRIKEADCPDKVCVKTGWISEPGQNIVCLPHKLMILIEGKNSTLDGFVY